MHSSASNLASPGSRNLTGARRTLASLILLYVIGIIDRKIIALMIDPIKASIGVDNIQMGMLQGLSFTLMSSLVVVPVGWMVDRYDRRLILAMGVFIWSSATIGTGLSHSYGQMFVARMFVGAGEAVLVPVALSLIADLYAVRHLAVANSIFTSAASVGSGTALMAGGAMMAWLASKQLPYDLEPWRAAFILCGLTGYVAALLVLVMRDPRSKAAVDPARTPSNWKAFSAFVRASRKLLICQFLGFVSASTVMYSYSSWSAHYLMRHFGWDVRDAGLVFGSIVGFCAPAGVIGGGFLVSHFLKRGRQTAHFDVPILAFIVGGPLMATAYLMPSAELMLGTLAVGTFLFSFYAAGSWTTLQLIPPPTMRGRLSAFYVALLGIAGGGGGPLLAPTMASLLGDQEERLGQGLALSIAMMATIALTAILIGRPILRKVLEDPARTAPAAG